MADNDEKLLQFMTVTGIDEERARFYMESSAWQLETALSSFYEHDDNTGPDAPPPPQNESPPPTGEVEDSDPEDASHQSGQTQPKSKNKPKRNTKFATVHTLNSSSEEDEEEGQAFYAGGSEHSGQQVLGPSKKKDFVSEMFKSVREHGVEIVDNAAGGSSRRVFGGTGYKLGQTSDDTETIPGAPQPTPPAHVTLKLWQDGFSLDDGELRHYKDPNNQDFLDSIRRGEIPQELRRGTSEVHVSMEDHRMESFSKGATRKQLKAFSGQGYTLGSPAPATVGAPLVEDNAVNEAHARQNVNVDPDQPTTNIQIRLADGSRLLGQFNHMHTIGQVRSFIIAARPQYQTRAFSLLSSYPPKQLEDSQTLSDAGVLNSAILQKLN